MAIEAERTGDFIPEIGAEGGFATDATDHFADQPAEGHGVITVTGARPPPRLLLGQRRAHRLPVQKRRIVERLADGGEARAMAQQVTDRESGLARLREFGPISRDRFVKVDLALVNQSMSTDGGYALARRIHVDDRIALPRLGFCRIGPSAP